MLISNVIDYCIDLGFLRDIYNICMGFFIFTQLILILYSVYHVVYHLGGFNHIIV